MACKEEEEGQSPCHQRAVNLEAETPMPMSLKLDVDKSFGGSARNNLPSDSSTASDILHLYGKKNTAKVKLSISYSENGTRSYLERAPSIEECLETNDDFRFQSRTCKCLPKRYVLALLSFLGFFNVYCLRVDLSVALVAMTTNYTRVRSDGTEYMVSILFSF